MTNTINTPLTLPSGLEIPNRLVKAAMTERLADPRNELTQQILTLYKTWGEGGIGLQITGNVMVDQRNLEAPGNVVIDGEPSANHAAMLAKWAEAAKAGGAKIIMQLSHAGRQTLKTVNREPDAPSAVTVKMPGGQFGQPRAMTRDDIAAVVEKFAIAVRAARKAGFDGVQIHSAHGYLLSQFLSPLTNLRDDEWGGSLKNRARLLIEIVRAAKAEAAPGFAVAVKLNSTDFQKGGFSKADSMAVVEMLNGLDLDFVEISGGNYEQPRMVGTDGLEPIFEDGVKASTKKREAYFLDYAQEVQAIAAMPLMVTGGFRSAQAMNEALGQDGADLIGIGRPLCVDTDAPGKLLSGEIQALTRWEDILRFGPGLLDKTSPFALIKTLNGFAAVSWYYAQMSAIADGNPTNQKLGLFKAFLGQQGRDRKMAKAYHKALAEL